MLVFVPPEQVPVDARIQSVSPDHMRLASLLFDKPDPPPAVIRPPVTASPKQTQQPLVRPSGGGAHNFWSMGLISKTSLLLVVGLIGLLSVASATALRFRSNTSAVLNIGTVYVLLVAVAFALA